VRRSAVTRLGFRLAGRPTAERGLSLLLLRVFALGPRSERAVDAQAKRWRRIGTIELIAGPDLVTSTVEPHEFLDFLAGRLSRRFLHGEADLEQRVASRDRGPDPDGRYRLNEFFCHADTWQGTMGRLAAEADVVLMDLRSFSPTDQGCITELAHMLAAVPLDRVLLIEDATTDEPFLRETLETLWSRLPAGSPNRSLAEPALRIFRLGKRPTEEMAGLVRHLLHRSTASAPLPQPAAGRSQLEGAPSRPS
jgi:hypothetical protein